MIVASELARLDVTNEPVDFRRSLPPHVPELQTHLATALEQVSRRQDLGMLMRQSAPRGTDEDRAAGCKLLQPRFGEQLDANRVIVANGTQNALLVLLRTLVGSGGVLLVERLTYGALPNLLRLSDVRAQAVDIDKDGLVPDAFEAACRMWRPKALYCNPTVHNPTTSVMSAARRLAIAEIARKYNVWILEDDALGRLHPEAPPPLAAMAPDITWYFMATTKCLTQGMRVAYCVMPDSAPAARLLAPFEHMSCWHAAPLCASVMNVLVTSGAADEITARIIAECTARERVAREVLAGLDLHSAAGSMHVWLRLPDSLGRADLVTLAGEQGVLLRTADVFSVGEQVVPNAVRLSLSPPATVDEVRRGLRTLRNLIDSNV